MAYLQVVKLQCYNNCVEKHLNLIEMTKSNEYFIDINYRRYIKYIVYTVPNQREPFSRITILHNRCFIF